MKIQSVSPSGLHFSIVSDDAYVPMSTLKQRPCIKIHFGLAREIIF